MKKVISINRNYIWITRANICDVVSKVILLIKNANAGVVGGRDINVSKTLTDKNIDECLLYPNICRHSFCLGTKVSANVAAIKYLQEQTSQ